MSEKSGVSRNEASSTRPALVVTDHLAVKIWAEMVGLGKPTKGSPTVVQIRAALERALEVPDA